MGHMSIAEFRRLVDDAGRNIDHFDRLCAAMELLDADIRLVKFSHASGLPAMREYRAYVRGHLHPSAASPVFRSLRGRLGAARRWQYCHQKQTFLKLLRVCTVVPGPLEALPPVSHMESVAAEAIWTMFKQAESRALSQRSRPGRR